MRVVKISYTKKDLINLLMLFEEDWAKENDELLKKVHKKTPEKWLEDMFEHYSRLDIDGLKNIYIDILNGFKEVGLIEKMIKFNKVGLIEEKHRWWIK